MGLSIDWYEYDDLGPRERYDAVGALIDEAKARVAAERARIAHDLAARVGPQEAARELGISGTRVYALAARHRDSQLLDMPVAHTTSSFDADPPKPAAKGWCVIACRRPRLGDTSASLYRDGEVVAVVTVGGREDEDVERAVEHVLDAGRRVPPCVPSIQACGARFAAEDEDEMEAATARYLAERERTRAEIGDLWRLHDDPDGAFDTWYDQTAQCPGAYPVEL